MSSRKQSRSRPVLLPLRATEGEAARIRALALASGLPLNQWMLLRLLGDEVEDLPHGNTGQRRSVERGEIAEGSLVEYRHPGWGVCRGEVLVVEADRLLVQDQAPTGAREWWPRVGCTLVGRKKG